MSADSLIGVSALAERDELIVLDFFGSMTLTHSASKSRIGRLEVLPSSR